MVVFGGGNSRGEGNGRGQSLCLIEICDAEWSQDRCGMVVGLMRMIAVVHPTIHRATSLGYAARLCTIIDCAMYTVSPDPQTFFVHGHPPRDYFMNLVLLCIVLLRFGV